MQCLEKKEVVHQRRNKIAAANNRFFAVICLFLVMLLITPLWTQAQAEDLDYPDRSITLVVPYSPGGMIDTSARIFAEFLEKHLKQPIVILNKTGGGTTIGGKYVASAKPDGYTLGFFPLGTVVPEAYAYFRKAPYSRDDLQPICRVMAATISISVRSDAPWNSFQELIKHAKENPGMKVGTQGVTSSGWLQMGSVIKKVAGVEFVNVPFRGGAKIIAALLGGHVPVGSPDYSKVKPLREANKLRPLAILAEKRASFAPDVPTMVELGYPLPYNSFVGLFGPRGIPEEIVRKLESLAGTIAKNPAFKERSNKMSMQVNYEDAAAFRKALIVYENNLETIFKEQGMVKK
jgi:tripartite-type tricarboxylate transporter receptor subunit TctC